MGGTGRLLLVRHGRPLVDPDTPSRSWHLDPAHADDVRRLAALLPEAVPAYSSTEPKALETAGLLGLDPVGLDVLCEQRRGGWVHDLPSVVRRAFAEPDHAAAPGWEPVSDLAARLLPAVRRLLAEHPEGDVVLVGHGTAWTVLVAGLTGTPPDLDRWASSSMPDLWVQDRRLLADSQARRPGTLDG